MSTTRTPGHFARSFCTFIVVCWFACGTSLFARGDAPAIFPAPQQFESVEGHFTIDDETVLALPVNASQSDRSLARFAVEEFADKHRVALAAREVDTPPKRAIVIGSVDNPLVRATCASRGIRVSAADPGPEGYVLHVSPDAVVIAGSDDRGAFHGLQSLRQLVTRRGAGLVIPCVRVRDWPLTSFRGIKMYIPGRENLTYFKRFVRDFMALYKFNRVILEVNAVMRLERHPELNIGGAEFAEDLTLSRRTRALDPDEYQNSTHHDAGDGGILEKAEVRDLVEFARRHHIDVIPEIPTLTHSFYLLNRHHELADVPAAQWPSTYCPSNPAVYPLLFDVIDEYIEVMKPDMIHIGRDEWWGTAIDQCPRCAGKNYFELFVDDLEKVHGHLSKRGVKVAMWGDHLLEGVRGGGYLNRRSKNRGAYQTPGGLPPPLVAARVPKDILVFNWFFKTPGLDGALAQFGFEQVYGNMLPSMSDWAARRSVPGMRGGAPSSWAATTEYNFGKDLLGYFLGCASLLWSSAGGLDPAVFHETTRQRMPGIRRNLDGTRLPSEAGEQIAPVPLEAHFNASGASNAHGMQVAAREPARMGDEHGLFSLGRRTPGGECAIIVPTNAAGRTGRAGAIDSIGIGEDVSSLLFLHACASPAKNEKAYRKVYNFADTADLLGWYEIVYEDGFVESVPIRYGYNILEWNVHLEPKASRWYDRGQGSAQDQYCYAADAIRYDDAVGGPGLTLHAFEWVNKRLGKKVRTVNLRTVDSFVDAQDKTSADNAIALFAISAVKARPAPFLTR